MGHVTYMDHCVVWLISVAGDKDACAYDRALVESGLLLYKKVSRSLREKVFTCYAGASIHTELVASNPSRTVELEALGKSFTQTDKQTVQFWGNQSPGRAPYTALHNYTRALVR